MKKVLILFIGIYLSLFFISDTFGEIYKCIDSAGQVTFTTKPGPGCKLLPGSEGPEQIFCDKFDLNIKLKNSTLTLSVATDLPDDTVIMVSVSRSYFEGGNDTEYSRDYFSEKSFVGKWKSSHEIYLSNKKWKSELQNHRKKMSRIGLGFDIAAVSNKIKIRMVVPINQKNPRFGKRNENLVGMEVRTTEIRIIEDEVEIDYPLSSESLCRSRFISLNPPVSGSGTNLYTFENKLH